MCSYGTVSQEHVFVFHRQTLWVQTQVHRVSAI